MKTLRDLNLEYWGRVHDMADTYNKAHGTDVKPWECVKLDGKVDKENFGRTHPKFNTHADEYELALAILEGRPLFSGEVVYSNVPGSTVKMIIGLTTADYCTEDLWTLTPPPPKRTFTLNGVELSKGDIDILIKLTSKITIYEGVNLHGTNRRLVEARDKE